MTRTDFEHRYLFCRTCCSCCLPPGMPLLAFPPPSFHPAREPFVSGSRCTARAPREPLGTRHGHCLRRPLGSRGPGYRSRAKESQLARPTLERPQALRARGRWRDRGGASHLEFLLYERFESHDGAHCDIKVANCHASAARGGMAGAGHSDAVRRCGYSTHRAGMRHEEAIHIAECRSQHTQGKETLRCSHRRRDLQRLVGLDAQRSRKATKFLAWPPLLEPFQWFQ